MTPKSEDLLKSIPYGAIGGAVGGIIIFSFASLIGRSGTTDVGYIGVWDWGNIALGIMYGGFFGLIMGPLGYIIFLRKIGLRKGILPAAIGTYAGACLGALSNVAVALFSGCLGFFVALAALRATYYFKDRSTTLRRT